MTKFLAAAILALSLAGCVEQPVVPWSGFYAYPTHANYYVPPPVVAGYGHRW